MHYWAHVMWQKHHMRPFDFATLSNKERNFLIASELKKLEDLKKGGRNG